MFCVFSGSGVKNLRQYLNNQRAAQEQQSPNQLGAAPGNGFYEEGDDNENEADGMEEDGAGSEEND